MSSPTVSAPQARANGGSELAETVLTRPEHGLGYFYPATASGTAVGLLGFASSLSILSMANAEWFKLSALIIVAPAALGFGAVALILAGMWEFRGGNAFNATWELAYGCFWLFLGLQLTVFAPKLLAAAGATSASHAFGAYLLIWALITAGFTVGTWFVARPAFIAFALLTVVFLILGIGNLVNSVSTANDLRKIGGWVGIVDALVAFYLAFGLMLNPLIGRDVLPLGLYPYKKS